VTPALENIIEANILLSGLGFESVGLSVAHAMQAGFTLFPEANDAMHGEKVAVGVLVQLVLEDAPTEELREVMDYYRSVGLPTSLKAIGIVEPTEEKLREVAVALLGPASLIHNVPFKLDEDMVYNAMAYVDQLDELFPPQ
jgi:glycerol dehydrogenase